MHGYISNSVTYLAGAESVEWSTDSAGCFGWAPPRNLGVEVNEVVPKAVCSIGKYAAYVVDGGPYGRITGVPISIG